VGPRFDHLGEEGFMTLMAGRKEMKSDGEGSCGCSSWSLLGSLPA
jgi:hypothetical protein